MKNDFKKQIMFQIKDNSLKIKSKWVYVAKKIGLKSGLALTMIALVFLINAFFYFIKTNRLFLPLHFGESIWQKLLHSLPYDLILIILFLAILFNFIIKKFDFSYKFRFSLIFLIFLGAIILFAVVVFYSNFNYFFTESLESYNFKIPFLSEFYLERCNNPCLNGSDNCFY